MEGDQQIPRPQFEPEAGLNFGGVKEIELHDGVDARASDHMHVGWRLAHLKDAGGRFFIGGEMQMRHLSHGVAEHVIDGALADVAAAGLDDREPEQGRGGNGSHYFLTVAEHQHGVGREFGEGAREPGNAIADGARNIAAFVAGRQHLDAAADGEAVGDDLVDRIAVDFRKMHTGGHGQQIQ